MMRPFGKAARPSTKARLSTHKAFNQVALPKRAGFCRLAPSKPFGSPKLPHLVRSMDAEDGEARCQDRDDALDHGQSRLCKICIIIDNEA